MPLGFLLGMIVAIVAAFLAGMILAPMGSAVLSLLAPLAGVALGGAVAGYSLEGHARSAVGFAVSFVVTLPIVLLTLVGLQGVGEETFSELAVLYGGVGAVVFGVMGLLGTGVSRQLLGDSFFSGDYLRGRMGRSGLRSPL